MTRLRMLSQRDKCALLFPNYVLLIGGEYVK